MHPRTYPRPIPTHPDPRTRGPTRQRPWGRNPSHLCRVVTPPRRRRGHDGALRPAIGLPCPSVAAPQVCASGVKKPATGSASLPSPARPRHRARCPCPLAAPRSNRRPGCSLMANARPTARPLRANQEPARELTPRLRIFPAGAPRNPSPLAVAIKGTPELTQPSHRSPHHPNRSPVARLWPILARVLCRAPRSCEIGRASCRERVYVLV